MVRETVKDERVITLIRRFLKSGVMVDGLVSQTTQGTPQGREPFTDVKQHISYEV
jgi:retron-type reverse transcriptase